MRKITLAATQANELGFDRRFDCLSDSFISDIDLIIQEHVTPRLDMHISLLRQINQTGTVLALTTEDICGVSWFLLADVPFFNELVVRSAQVAEERFSQLAKSTGMHIATCYFKWIDGRNYNVVSIFGPNGQILGEYRKTHVPPNEMWHIADGEELNIIELDFGRIGVLICYDMMFPEAASVLAMKGAEIILHPTAGYGWYDAIGEATLKTRANDNSTYILTAKNYVYNGAGKSSIIDPWGHVLADAGFYSNVIVSKEIDLDIPKAQPDWFYQSQMSGMSNIRQRYIEERRPELYTNLTEPARRLRVPNETEQAVLKERVRTGEARW
ncbi:MAG: carbon-nitrogen hydrolase family protein [Defluviitaleaceae bacterium]|nr:carbon-nitrogen hydrolase family protein [Defluviitaleaceae bacterium]